MSAIQKSTSKAVRTGKKTPKSMSIGVVLKTLQQQFPDVTVSKIRFLESEGLVAPQRTASGYRRFSADDLERLRYILTAQRDNYLPLKVIKEQLDALDSGQVSAIVGAAASEQIVSPDSFRAPVMTRLTDADLAEQSGTTMELVAEMVQAGLIAPDASGFFTNDDVRVVSNAAALQAFGFDASKLKTLRNNARRQADLISQVAAPVAQGKEDTAKQQAEELSQQLTALVVSLHATLVKNDLRNEYSS